MLPLSAVLLSYAEDRCRVPTLRASQRNVTQEGVSCRALAPEQPRPRQVGDAPTTRTCRPEVRVALALRFADRPGPPVGIVNHGPRSSHDLVRDSPSVLGTPPARRWTRN